MGQIEGAFIQEVKHRSGSSARFKIGSRLYTAIPFWRTGKNVLVKIGMDERSEGMKNGLSCGQAPWGSGVPEKEKATAPTERDGRCFGGGPARIRTENQRIMSAFPICPSRNSQSDLRTSTPLYCCYLYTPVDWYS